MSVSGRLQRAAGWAIVGGVLLGVVHFSTLGFWQTVISLILSSSPETANLAILAPLFRGILIIASLGGLAVVIAGILFLRGHARSGRLLIGFGAGFSLLSVLVYLVVAVVGRNLALSGTTIVVLVGLSLAIHARGLAKKD